MVIESGISKGSIRTPGRDIAMLIALFLTGWAAGFTAAIQVLK